MILGSDQGRKVYKKKLINLVERYNLNKKVKWEQVFGDGNASDIITDVLDFHSNFFNNQMSRSVCVVGLGYIGLPTSFLLARSGVKTVGFDIDENKIKNLHKNKLYFKKLQTSF